MEFDVCLNTSVADTFLINLCLKKPKEKQTLADKWQEELLILFLKSANFELLMYSSRLLETHRVGATAGDLFEFEKKVPKLSLWAL